MVPCKTATGVSNTMALCSVVTTYIYVDNYFSIFFFINGPATTAN